jgi:GTPase SAR1 family protein
LILGLRLTGEIKDISSSGGEVQPSTGSVEPAPSIVIRSLTGNTALVTQNEWVTSKNLTDEARMFIQFLYSHTEQKNKAPKKEKTDFKRLLNDFGKSRSKVRPSRFAKKDVRFDRIEKPQQTKKSGYNTVSEHGYGQLPKPAMEEVAELLINAVGPEYWKDIEHLFKDTAYLKMEDTGGQPEFMDMLPALTIGPALYLLFCKLTDDLKSRYTVSYLSPSGESTASEKSTYTMEELILTALSSISCFKSYADAPGNKSSEVSMSNKSSLAYIVSEEQIDDFDKTLQESIRSTHFFTKGLVKFSSENRNPGAPH